MWLSCQSPECTQFEGPRDAREDRKADAEKARGSLPRHRQEHHPHDSEGRPRGRAARTTTDRRDGERSEEFDREKNGGPPIVMRIHAVPATPISSNKPNEMAAPSCTEIIATTASIHAGARSIGAGVTVQNLGPLETPGSDRT